MNSLWKDTRYAMRTLLKRPGFAVIALLTLALGIGANTAIFSIVNGVLLRPLPFSEPDRLVWVWGRILNAGQRASVSPPDYLDYRALNKSFEHFAASMNVPYNLTSGGEPERLLGARVTGNYFQAFGVNAALGRTFSLDNEQSGQDQVVVLSDGLWKRRFGADPSIVTKTITLDGKSYQVLGVLPPSFRFPQSAELWAPLNFGAFPEMKIRKAHFLRPVGRLREGVSLAQAQSKWMPSLGDSQNSIRIRIPVGAWGWCRCANKSMVSSSRRFLCCSESLYSCSSSRARTLPICCSCALHRDRKRWRFVLRLAQVAGDSFVRCSSRVCCFRLSVEFSAHCLPSGEWICWLHSATVIFRPLLRSASTRRCLVSPWPSRCSRESCSALCPRCTPRESISIKC